MALIVGLCPAGAGTISVPNHSFESPPVPQVAPYAGPSVDDWQKTPQPVWYDPSQNNNTLWEYLVGAAYALTAGVVGGGGGMKSGATLLLGLYYRDAAGNKVIVAATSITNSPALFPTNTHFVDFQARVPAVQPTDPWAGQRLGIQLLSTTGFELAGGYWDVDNVRLTETITPALAISQPTLANGQFAFEIRGVPQTRFEVQAAEHLTDAAAGWVSLGTFTNVTGVTSFADPVSGKNLRFYRARQL